MSALCREIRLLGEAAKELPEAAINLPEGAQSRLARLPVHTVFLGGGTPSLLPLKELERIFTAVREAFDLLPRAEISLEANPGTVDLAGLRGLRELGVNRLSLGMQSAHADELELLGRIHTFEQVVQAVEWARQAGFDNLNLDAIFGLPGQSLERWKGTLQQALRLGVEHLSLYALTLEEGTTLLEWVRAGQFPEPDPDKAADMYDLATEMLEAAGYQQYEISNWAKNDGKAQTEVENPSYACQHNLQYWRNLPYLGVGAGAHGYIRWPFTELLEGSGPEGANSGAHGYIREPTGERAGERKGGHRPPKHASEPAPTINMRIADTLTPAEYIRRMRDGEGKPFIFPQTPAAAQVTQIDTQTEIGETMMMGLRLTREGVSQTVFRMRFGRQMTDVFGTQIERLRGLGLLEWAGTQQDVLRLTPRARFVGNRVFMEFI